MMATEPNSVQRDRMLAHGKTRLTHVQFLIGREPSLVTQYLMESKRIVLEEDGNRDHQLGIDKVLAGGDLPYQYLTVDSFPSSQALLMAHERSREVRLATLDEIYGIYLSSKSLINRTIKSAGRLAPTLSRWLGTQESRKFPDGIEGLDPETDPDLEVVKEFSSHHQDQSFYMMNLNQFSLQEDRRYISGKSAYKRYSAWITPYLISVGGYPDIYTRILGTFLGDQNSGLFNQWDDFALVYYPSRASFLRLMTNTPRRAAAFRRLGLKKALLMACVELS